MTREQIERVFAKLSRQLEYMGPADWIARRGLDPQVLLGMAQEVVAEEFAQPHGRLCRVRMPEEARRAVAQALTDTLLGGMQMGVALSEASDIPWPVYEPPRASPAGLAAPTHGGYPTVTDRLLPYVGGPPTRWEGSRARVMPTEHIARRFEDIQ